MDNSRFIICRASAGSGKTYTLVRQYLLLAFSANEQELPSRFKRILAITFTNKAANEMKERILRELDNISLLGTGTPMGADIADRTSLDSTTLQRYAAIVRQAVLHNYSDLSVCTIDSFMHRIVRTFAHDLDLPMNFDVQIDNDILIQSAVDDLMSLAGAEGQEELTEVLCDFAESRMTDGKSYMIENELASLAQELFKEQTPQYLRLLKDIDSPQFRSIHRSMVADNRAYERRLAALGQQAVDTFTAAGLADTDFFHGSTGAGVYFRKLASGLIVEPNSYVLAYLEGDKLGSAKCTPSVRDALATVKPPLADLFTQIQQLRSTDEVLYNTRQLLLKNIYSLALLNKLNLLIDHYSKENEIVHISEFNQRISEVVQDEPVPFIYERIGNRYYNYLIDEFQDTSRLQWQNLVPLLENGVGSGHTSLVVGATSAPPGPLASSTTTSLHGPSPSALLTILSYTIFISATRRALPSTSNPSRRAATCKPAFSNSNPTAHPSGTRCSPTSAILSTPLATTCGTSPSSPATTAPSPRFPPISPPTPSPSSPASPSSSARAAP